MAVIGWSCVILMLVILDFGLGLIAIPPLVNCGVLEPLLQAFVGVLGKEMITYGIVWFGMVLDVV